MNTRMSNSSQESDDEVEFIETHPVDYVGTFPIQSKISVLRQGRQPPKIFSLNIYIK